MIAFLVALNTGGAIGDLFVFARLLKLSPSSYVNDTGDVVDLLCTPIIDYESPKFEFVACFFCAICNFSTFSFCQFAYISH